LETGEYRGFAGQFPDCLRQLAVTWRWPLLFSLLLHAFAFWPVALREAPAGSPDLRASLRQTVLRPVPPIVQAADAPRTRERPSPSRASDHTASAVAPPLPIAGTTTVMQETPGLDAGAVRGYRIALARLLASSEWRSGLRPTMRGEMEIGIAITAAGLAEGVEMVRGSGDAALDRQVLGVVRAAANAVVVPAPLYGSVVMLPVEVISATAEDR
jgi:TonB family protein